MIERAESSVFFDVSALLSPQSIAVVGASDQPGNLGGVAIRLLRKFGYPERSGPSIHAIPRWTGSPAMPG
jgi:hypothetical protein